MSLQDLARAAGLSEDDEELLALLLAEEGIELAEDATIPRRSQGLGAEEAPLSFAQERLWFIDRLNPGSPAYNLPTVWRLHGDLKVEVLARALGEIVRRHESLRTSFPERRDGEPRQRIAPATPVYPIRRIDLSGLPTDRRGPLERRLLRREMLRPFSLERGPLMRVLLIHSEAAGHLLALTLHHAVSDGWSMGVLTREVATLYAAGVRGRPSPLPEPAIQYPDFAVWQREHLSGERLASELDWWKGQLAGVPALELPADRPRPPLPSFRGASRSFQLAPGPSDRLRELAQREGATGFMVMLAALAALCHRLTGLGGQTDFVLGSMIANRNRREVEELIGFFVNALALRADLSGDPDFATLLGRARETALAAFAHQDLPFEKLVAEILPSRDLSRSPLFQVVFQVFGGGGVGGSGPVPGGEGSGGLELPGLALRPLGGGEGDEAGGFQPAKFDLLFSFTESRRGLGGLCTYSLDLYTAPTIARWLGHLEALLTQVAAEPDRPPLSRIVLLSPAERHQLRVEWARTRTVGLGEGSLAAEFEAQVARTPAAPALSDSRGEVWSYRELNRRANRWAHRLRALGVGPEVRVALCAERSLEMVMGTLAIVKAGGVYVPLDAALPDERLDLLLADALPRAPLLLIYGMPAERFAAFRERGGTILDLAGMAEATAQDDLDLPATAGPESLAYVMYTSGSTGKPKGVAVPQGAVLRLVRETGWDEPRHNPQGSGLVFLQLTRASFDVATLEIWAPLLLGGRLAIFPAHTPSLADLGAVVASQGITHLWLTSGLLHHMVEGNLDGLAPLSQLLSGGDVLSPAHCIKVRRELPGVRLINGYGPTENTTFTTCHVLAPGEELDPLASIPIGRPIANTEVLVLDRDFALVPAGIPGELGCAGDGLARGYLDRPDLTAERFVPHPASEIPGDRLYRIGDRARFLNDGSIEFLGRIDQQIKIRGYRIEPGEIEAALLANPELADATVIARDDGAGKQLVAYLVPRGEAEVDLEALRRALRAQLPEYMVPAFFIPLASIPLTFNGKVDRRALPSPEAAGVAGGAGEDEAPRTPLEEQLAAIWCEVLGRRKVGIRDDFFALGGHSLLAVRLMARLREVCGAELPVTALFAAPTVEAMAALLSEERREAVPADSPLVPIQPAGSRPPLFLVHPSGGNVFCYAELARELGAEQPVYGLRAGGLAGGPVEDRVEAMAATYLAAIRQVQPQGPYRLGGWSTGGVVAFEMAHQLLRAGEQVAALVLLDAAPPGRNRGVTAEDDTLLVAALHRDFAGLSGGAGRLGLSRQELLELPPEERIGALLAAAARAGLVAGEAEGRRLWEVFRANVRAPEWYAAPPLPSPFTVLRARQSQGIEWGPRAAAGITQIDLEGDHYSLLQKPAVRAVAEQLRTLLSGA